MDQHRLATLTRSLSSVPSRRDVLHGITSAGLGLAALGALGLAEAGARNRRKKRRRRKRRKQRQQEKPEPHVCAGRNACFGAIADTACGADPNCFCFVTDEGEPYCGKGNGVSSCQQCEQQFPGRDCFPGGGPFCTAFSCLEPCPV